MKYLIYLLFILVSCKQKGKDNPIVGKWEYERMEMYSGEPMNLEDSLINSLHQQQKGWTFSFTRKNVFKVTNTKANNPEDFVAEQPLTSVTVTEYVPAARLLMAAEVAPVFQR